MLASPVMCSCWDGSCSSHQQHFHLPFPSQPSWKGTAPTGAVMGSQAMWLREERGAIRILHCWETLINEPARILFQPCLGLCPALCFGGSRLGSGLIFLCAHNSLISWPVLGQTRALHTHHRVVTNGEGEDFPNPSQILSRSIQRKILPSPNPPAKDAAVTPCSPRLFPVPFSAVHPLLHGTRAREQSPRTERPWLSR